MNTTTVDTAAIGERTVLATTARLLGAASTAIGALGLFSAALAALGLALSAARAAPASLVCLGLVLLLLPLERLLALRLRFDAGLFADLAHARATPLAALDALDAALLALRLRAPAATRRPVVNRVLGARRLLLWHAATVAAQYAAELLALGLGLRLAP